MRLAGPTITVAWLAVVMAAAPRASGQEGCSCAEKDPAASVELEITDAMPGDHSRIGPEQETLVVDLRGERTVLVGDAPELLAGVDLAEVPVLMAVVEGAADVDGCATVRPAAGSDLSLTGQVYVEETGPVVWTGVCQGTLTVGAAPQSGPDDEGTWERGLAISAALLAGLAIVCLTLALSTGGGDRRPPDP